MSLNALSNATAGLAATQAAINLVSQNVANAGTAGYVKRTISPVANGANNLGVASGTITRSFDAAALKQLRLETSGAAYTSTKAGIASQLDALYGVPGSSTSLDGTLNTFTQSLQQLAANPTSAAARTTVVSNASALASQINSAANTVQNMRTGIESQLGTDVNSASALLSNIANLNTKIQNTTDGSSLADLQDQRDQAINSLSSYMDVQTVSQGDGTVTVLTRSGATLVDRGNAASLTFDEKGTLTANSSSTNPGTVGTITATLPGGGIIDLSEPNVLRSGSLAAQLELRDQILPQAQRQLDDLAAGLASALTDKQVSSTQSTGNSATINLTGMQAGNTLTIPANANSTGRNIILVASNNSSAITANQTTDANALVATIPLPVDADSINAVLNRFDRNLSASGSAASLTIAGAAGAPSVAATANITVPTSADPKSGYPQIALFVDGSDNTVYTGSLDAGSKLTGFAQRISVNGNLSGNTAALTATNATDMTANGARAQQLFSALTSTQQTFSSASGIGGVSAPYHATVVGFAQDIIATQGANASNASALDATQQTALSTAQGRFAAGAGVNIDQEMSNLIALQNAYGANARILSAARDMLNQLLQI
ncbi:flagellar hook-associated protein FlgK [Methylobacterium radiotolerans]|uniref:flagellar hook-associated protein FlgK n=1 Tax=Methylobacterium TaxID=407 RepID=UPI0005E77D15|nr:MULTISPECIES: flagellar hook-associated protein FlgK [Methylobacterium]MBN6821644.1 flagellar hook-associated protein FlgK [Methylobacterium organophilum]OXE38015.1 flagellar hook-associated protein FlgK [Methylobacterium radiotolerans]GAN52377.1 flagellar hook-associated protein FlgK [Methylobacterium sp. ME121]